MRIKQTRHLSSAVRAVNNVSSAAIANRARRLRHAPSSELRAGTFVNSDCVECNRCVISQFEFSGCGMRQVANYMLRHL